MKQNPLAIVRPHEDLKSLAAAINQEHQAGTAATEKGITYFRSVGEKLTKAKAQVGHGRWQDWIASNLKFDERTARRYMSLAKLPKTDAASVLESWSQIEGHQPRVTRNTGENEWYTPAWIIEAARNAMGGIDLDPASSDIAQQTVKAGTYFTKETNGLEQTWAGRVWLNPPYDRSCPLFIDKLLDSPDVNQAIALTNNATETAWFQALAKASAVFCLLNSRVAFLDSDGRPGSPTQGQVLFYIGGNPQNFMTAFAEQGYFAGGK